MNFIFEKDRVILKDDSGKIVAKLNTPLRSDSVVHINHTFVDDSLRGQGIASKIVEACAQKLRGENKKAILTCPYSIKWFERHPDYSDVVEGVEPEEKKDE